MVTAAIELKDACSLEEKLWQIQIAYKKAEILLCQNPGILEHAPFIQDASWTVQDMRPIALQYRH